MSKVTLAPFGAKDGFKFRGTGVSTTITKNTTANLDYKLPEDRNFNGLEVFLEDHEWGDTVLLQVVDVDGIMSPAGTILDEFGTDWNIDPTTCSQGKEKLDYPATIYKDLYLRLRYTSTGTTNDVKIKCNHYLHKPPAP